MKKLTEKQKEILKFINEYLDQNLKTPTLKDIATHFDITSVAVYYQLQSIEKKGYIEIDRKESRGIKLRPEDSQKRINYSIPFFPEEPKYDFSLDSTDDYFYISKEDELKHPYAFRVTSLSMKDIGIMQGDIAIMESAKDARDGDIVLACVPDRQEKAELRRYIKTPHFVVLQSENESMGNIKSTSVIIYGVLRSIRRNYS